MELFATPVRRYGITLRTGTGAIAGSINLTQTLCITHTQRQPRALDEQGQHLDLARSAEHLVAVLSAGGSIRLDGCDRRRISSGHSIRWTTMDDHLPWLANRGGIVGYAGD